MIAIRFLVLFNSLCRETHESAIQEQGDGILFSLLTVDFTTTTCLLSLFCATGIYRGFGYLCVAPHVKTSIIEVCQYDAQMLRQFYHAVVPPC